MPLLVVPSRFLPSRRSMRRSSSVWYGMIRWALPLTRSRLQSTPRASRPSISATSTPGSMTTPLPITGVTHGWRTPLGTSCRANLSSATTMVWPALWPPW